MHRLGTLFCILAIACTGELVGAHADPVPWHDAAKPYFKAAQNQPLEQVLREFAADQGVPVSVSEKVQQSVSGQFGPLPPQQFLDRITQANGLVWYFDGHALFVYRSDELQSAMLAVQATTAADVLEKLDRLGVLATDYPLKTLPENNIIYASGPPRYLEIIKQAVESIEATSQSKVNVEVAVEVYPLRYAWADDQAFQLNGQQVIVPGVATLMKNLITGQQTQGLQGRLGPLPNFNLPGLKGQGLSYRENLAAYQSNQAAVNAQVAAAEAQTRVQALETRVARDDEMQAAAEAQIKAVVQSDPRLNAVVIRDLRSRLPMYREVISQLDKPTGLVQIEAHLVDVDANAGFEFGLPYGAEWRHNGNQHTAALGISPTATPNFTLRIANDGVNQLLTTLRALETDGRARFVSRPSVLTINNVEANLDSTSTFFVRVGGQFEVDLFDVTVGTTMRIVPHIVCEETGRRIKLIVRVEDGRTTPDQVDNIPIITRNTINTQAVLNEGESLLIGGLIREEVTKTESRVPILGRLPGVGALFTTQISAKNKFERVVLIRPRVIDLPAPGQTENGLMMPLNISAPACENAPLWKGPGTAPLADGEQLLSVGPEQVVSSSTESVQATPYTGSQGIEPLPEVAPDGAIAPAAP